MTESQTQGTHLQLPRDRAGGEGKDWEFGVSRCKLEHIGGKHQGPTVYTGNTYCMHRELYSVKGGQQVTGSLET